MKKIVLCSFTFFLAFSVLSQEKINIDSFFSALDNDELYIAPKIGGVNVAAKAKQPNTNSQKINSQMFVISSLPFTIDQLCTMYTKDYLISKLYPLINDNKKDLYVNAILYNLTDDNKSLAMLVGIKRSEWVNSGRETTDKKNWNEKFRE